MQSHHLVPLSASTIVVFEHCLWQLWCRGVGGGGFVQTPQTACTSGYSCTILVSWCTFDHACARTTWVELNYVHVVRSANGIKTDIASVAFSFWLPHQTKARALTDYFPSKDKAADEQLQALKATTILMVTLQTKTMMYLAVKTPGQVRHSGSVVSPPILDVGELVNSSSSDQLESTVHSLTNSQKYQYLT